MNELQIFSNEEFGEIRSVAIDGTPWLAGRDIAEKLGYKNTKDALRTHVNVKDKRLIQRSDFTTLENHIPKEVLNIEFVNGEIPNRGLTFINESGLYALVLGSKLESAVRFKHWVTSEVLPQLRTTGAYCMNPHHTSDLDEIKARTEYIKQLNQLITLCNGDISTVNELLGVKGTNIPKQIKPLKNDDFERWENRFETIDKFLDTHVVNEGDVTKDVYENYVRYCGSINQTPRTRQAFVSRLKVKCKLATIVVHRDKSNISIITKF